MTTPRPISPELQARIDALSDENLKTNILRFLGRSWKRTKSNEQIFDEMVAEHQDVMVERAKWYQWDEEEVLAFSEHFKKELPDDYADYLKQEIDNNEINADLSWKVEKLSKEWRPGLASIDYILLLGKLRSYLQENLRANHESQP